MASRFRQILEARRRKVIAAARYREREIDVPRDMTLDLMVEGSTVYLPVYGEVTLLTVPLVTETDAFFIPTWAATAYEMILVDRLEEPGFFYALEYSATPNQMTVDNLILETDAAFTPEYKEVDLMAVPAVITETDAAYGPTYTASPVQLTVPAIDEIHWVYPTQYVASQKLMVVESRFSTTDAAYQPTYAEVDLMAVDNLISETDAMFTPTWAATVGTLSIAAIISETDTVYQPTVGEVDAMSLAAVIAETDTFYQPTITAGGAVTHPDYFYYTRNNFTPGDVEILRITPAGTETSLISSVETLFTDDQDLVAAIEYMNELDMFVVALREHTQFSVGPRSFLMTTDGTVRQLVDNLSVSEISGLSAYAWDSVNDVLAVGSTSNAIRGHYLGSYRIEKTGGIIGGDEILGMVVKPDTKEVLYVDSAANSGIVYVGINSFTDSTSTSWAGVGSRSFTAICANWDAVNADLSTGRVWAFDSGNDTIYIYDGSGNQLSTLDLSSLGAFSVPQLRYDAVNDNIYFLRSNGGSEAIWWFPAVESPTIGQVEELVTLQSNAARFDVYNGSDAGVIGSDPSDISGLHLWLDAADCLNHSDVACSNGDTIKTWPDQSGNGFDATQTNSSLAPTFNSADTNLNSLPSVDFGTASNAFHMLLPDGTIVDDWTDEKWTIIVVGQKDDSSINNVWWGGDYDGGEGVGIGASGQMRYEFRTASATTADSYHSIDTGLTSAFAAVWFLNKTDGFVEYTEIGTSGVPGVANLASYTPASWPVATINQCLGMQPRVDLPSTDTANMYQRWEGTIAEIIVYNKELNANEMETVMKYLNTKYGSNFGK